MEKVWKTSRRNISLKKTLVMAILNVTPDSFSDGGKFTTVDSALRQAEKLVADGADILDIGGESTRPNSVRVSAEEEINRVVPIIKAIAEKLNIPISIDTSKSEVAKEAVEAGAEIINDISGLQFDKRIAEVAAAYQTGLVLMHLRGSFETMHKQSPVEDILPEIKRGLTESLRKAKSFGVQDSALVLDVGIGFGKTLEQNLELIAKLDKLVAEFPQYPILVGTSRKSFIGKILKSIPPAERVSGSLASAVIAIWKGARIVRVHDVKQTVEALKVVDVIKKQI